MNKFSIMNTASAKCGLGLTLIAALVACGGNDDSAPVPVAVAATNVSVGTSNTTTAEKTATASVLAAVTSTPITFPNGFAGVDANGAPVAVTEPTTVAFSANTTDATKPGFAISSASGSASGTTTLGSCTFTVTTSNYNLASPFRVGSTFKVDPCTVTIETAGKAVNIPADVPIKVIFGIYVIKTTASALLSSNGELTVRNKSVNITVPLLSGVSGAGS